MTIRTLTTTLIILFASTICSGQVTFNGCRLQPIKVDVEASTGLDALYVLDSVEGNPTMSFTIPTGSTTVQWTKWGYQGAAYGSSVDPTLINTSNGVSTLTITEGDCGYAVNYGADTYYVWITDYSKHEFSIRELRFAADQDCSSTTLDFEGNADKISYYSITARNYELPREIYLTYDNLVVDEENAKFTKIEQEKIYHSLATSIIIDNVLCETRFTLEGDKYLKAWGKEVSISTPTISPHSIGIVSRAEQTQRDNDNEIKVETTLGGSAPVDISFRSAVSDAVVIKEWQMSRDEDFYEITYRNSDADFDYTFTEMGTIYVRLFAANASGECEQESEVYTIYIGESDLKCPNAFSPGSSIGVNDEWRVSYKSIVSFECYIFDRWGTKMFEFHNPAEGWDGRYRGKYVPSGVYYYVIKAKGADGKEYNLGGDINILKSNR